MNQLSIVRKFVQWKQSYNMDFRGQGTDTGQMEQRGSPLVGYIRAIF